jgi:hypothetical protein
MEQTTPENALDRGKISKRIHATVGRRAAVAKVLCEMVTKMVAKRIRTRVSKVLHRAIRRGGWQYMREPDAWRLGYFDARELPEYLVMRSNQERFRRFQLEHRSRVQRRFYITVVPRTLDLLDYCLKLLPADLNVFLILNGLADWERAYIAAEYPDIPHFTLETRSGSILYDRVLDLLMEENECDFGILDQDCFVLDESLFDQLQFRRNELVMSPFFSANNEAKIEFPRTYFLYFNVPVVKGIRDKYRISFKRCWTLPLSLEEKLAELNLGYRNFPHASLNYFDNFQLIWAMAMHERIPFGRLPTTHGQGAARSERVVHIGAGHAYLTRPYRDSMMKSLGSYDDLSRLEREKLCAAAFCHYAHLRLLEASESEVLRRHYLPFFSTYEGSRGVRQSFRPLINPDNIKKLEVVVEEAQRREGR